MNLILDLGNTRKKAFLFEKSELIHHGEFTGTQSLSNFLQERKIAASIIGSSIPIPTDIIELIKKLSSLIVLDQNTELPVANGYATPQTLGYDRMAAALGARQLFPGSPVLAVVAGTCITYNIIQNEKFIGGAISPGLKMRSKAMHDFTAKLPEVKVEATAVTGTDTETSLRSGIYNGAIAEINGMITLYENEFPGLKTVIGGGASPLLAKAIKNGIFARPNLVAEGLNSILDFHVSNNLL